jgi:hypothetical protein
MRSIPRCYKEYNWCKSSESCKGVWQEMTWCSLLSVRNEVSMEAEESQLLEVVAKERLMQTQQTE